MRQSVLRSLLLQQEHSQVGFSFPELRIDLEGGSVGLLRLLNQPRLGLSQSHSKQSCLILRIIFQRAFVLLNRLQKVALFGKPFGIFEVRRAFLL